MISASPSRIGTFTECPFKYQLEYIDKIELKEDKGEALRFGSFIHKVMELLVKSLRSTGKPKDPQFVNDNFGWLADAHKLNDEARMRARGMLAIFLSKDIDVTKVAEIEALVGEEFPKIEDVKVWGRFDRVDFPAEGMVEVVDYKTGRTPEEEDLKHDLQYVFYSWMVQKKYPEKKARIRWFFLESSKEIVFDAMPIEQAEVIMEGAIMPMISAKEFPKMRNKYCKYCGYLKEGHCDMNLHTRIEKKEEAVNVLPADTKTGS